MAVHSFQALAASCVLILSAPILAEEGMWMPRQVPELAGQLADKGYKIDAKSFSNLAGSPMGAVVSLGGCSASFVSPDGLIITNHHCVRSALQYNATPERDLLKDGYLAKTRAEELPAGPGSRASITVSMTDVTDEITGKIDPVLSDRDRYEIIERRSKERVAKCEKGGLRCRVASFFEGNRYFEIAQQEVSDIRLVYAPHSGIGRFGGETDNWRWPRHTGDYSFYRAYVAPDGSNATYAKDNVPYHPKQWVKIDVTGVDPGETLVVTGYPGNTRRLDTFQEIKRMAEWTLPRSIQRAEDQIAILDELAKRDAETAIKIHNRVAGLNNGLTNNRGKLQGLISSKLLDTKAAREKSLAAWIAADPKRQKEYGDVLAQLDALTAEENKTRLRDSVLSESAKGGSSVLSSADTIYRLSLDRPKPDLEREPAYQERNWKRIREREERAQRTLDAGVDRAIFRYNLLEVAKLPEGSRLVALDKAAGLTLGMSDADAGKAIDAFLDKAYAGTHLFDKDFRLGLLDKSTADVVATKDPFIDMAVAMYPESHEVEERKKAQEGLRSRLAPTYIKALLESSGGLLAPDANGTLRVTFGKVEGVAERDGLVYLPQTTLAGIVEKHQGKGDFDAPARELDAIAAMKGKTVPVNFLASVDTTGGNSGSPAFNAKGELVGLLFDGTFDTVGSDVVFDPVRTRSILVDIRYVLWVMGEVDGATALLTEMGIR
ncbi:MAG TPA: S46 family peptidase [Candidatus Polarisedimenticolaceae bacterium]|nr:S46 family peptidase [Candidatus Polarisedimenticolaceae bacterium]